MSELSLIKVTKAEPLGGYRLRLRFSDGSIGERDFADVVASGGPMLDPLRDPAYFARVFIDYDAPTWPNGYDLAPSLLHAEMVEARQLKADVEKGLSDFAAGRVRDFDADRIARRGRKLLRGRSRST